MSADNNSDDDRMKWRKRFIAAMLLFIALYFYLGTYLHL